MSSIKLDDPVYVDRGSVIGGRQRLEGIVSYLGRVEFAPPGEEDDWVGVELIGKKGAGLGKNNGTVQGTQYFVCPDHCGLFVRRSSITKRKWNRHDSERVRISQIKQQRKQQRAAMEEQRNTSFASSPSREQHETLDNEQGVLSSSMASTSSQVSPGSRNRDLYFQRLSDTKQKSVGEVLRVGNTRQQTPNRTERSRSPRHNERRSRSPASRTELARRTHFHNNSIGSVNDILPQTTQSFSNNNGSSAGGFRGADRGGGGRGTSFTRESSQQQPQDIRDINHHSIGTPQNDSIHNITVANTTFSSNHILPQQETSFSFAATNNDDENLENDIPRCRCCRIMMTAMIGMINPLTLVALAALLFWKPSLIFVSSDHADDRSLLALVDIILLGQAFFTILLMIPLWSDIIGSLSSSRQPVVRKLAVYMSHLSCISTALTGVGLVVFTIIQNHFIIDLKEISILIPFCVGGSLLIGSILNLMCTCCCSSRRRQQQSTMQHTTQEDLTIPLLSDGDVV